jgi:hypothetical protein
MMLHLAPHHPDGQETLSSFKQLLLDTDRKDEIEDMLLWKAAKQFGSC